MTTHPALALFKTILRTARRHDASDIHLISRLPPAFRVNGEVVLAQNCEPLSFDDLRDMTKILLSPIQLQQFEQKKELCVSFFDDANGRIRLSLYHRLNAPEMSIRMCNLEIKPAADLMLPAVVDDLATRTSGLILVTGPTGMGKTTTLNYLIDIINNTRRGKIVTIEDPIEFEHAHNRCIVTQIEVGTDTLSFASCLRHVLRLDPDVIVIGEMRDLDTIETALTAAETGHLVIATLHTPSAVATFDRIIGSFSGEKQAQVTMQLASCLQCVIAQRLIPTISKEKRVLATETVMAAPAVSNLVREGRVHQLYNVIASSRKEGMHSLEDSLHDLYSKGQISYDQALVNSVRQDVMKDLLATR